MKKKNNDNSFFIILGILAVIIIGIIVFIFIVNKGKITGDEGKEGKEQEKEVQIKEYSEQDLIDSYGMSIKEAENLVMEYYHSDNFEPSTIVDGTHYKVTVTDILTNEKVVYDVNPASGEYTQISK